MEGRGRALDVERRARLIPHQLCLAAGLVITHVISHYCFLVQHQRAAEGRPVDGGLVDGGLVDGRAGLMVWAGGVDSLCGIFDASNPSICRLRVVSSDCHGDPAWFPLLLHISHLHLSGALPAVRGSTWRRFLHTAATSSLSSNPQPGSPSPQTS